MASGPTSGPNINIPFDPEGLQYLEQFKAAAQEASRRATVLDKEMAQLIKKGGTPGTLRIDELNKAEAVKKQAQEAYKTQFEAQKLYRTNIEGARRLERLAARTVSFVNSPLVRKLATGQSPDGTDVFREIFQSERLVKSAVKTLFGTSSKLLQLAAPSLTLGFAAYEIGRQIIQSREAKAAFADEIQRQFGRGDISSGLLQNFQSDRAREGFVARVFGIDNAKETMESVRAAAKILPQLDQTGVEAALNAVTNSEISIAGGWKPGGLGGSRSSDINEQRRKTQYKINHEQAGFVKEELQKALAEKNPTNQKDRDIVIEDTIARLQQQGLLKLDKAAAEALKKAVEDQKSWIELQDRSKSPDQRFAEHEKERVLQAAWDVHRRRVSASPTD